MVNADLWVMMGKDLGCSATGGTSVATTIWVSTIVLAIFGREAPAPWQVTSAMVAPRHIRHATRASLGCSPVRAATFGMRQTLDHQRHYPGRRVLQSRFYVELLSAPVE